MLDLVVHPGLPDDEPVDVDTKVPDQWEMIKCMKIKLKDTDIEGTSMIFCLNRAIAEIKSCGPFRLIPPRTCRWAAKRESQLVVVEEAEGPIKESATCLEERIQRQEAT